MGRPVPPNNVLQVAEVVLNPILNTGKGFRTQPSVKDQKGGCTNGRIYAEPGFVLAPPEEL